MSDDELQDVEEGAVDLDALLDDELTPAADDLVDDVLPIDDVVDDDTDEDEEDEDAEDEPYDDVDEF